MQSWFPFIPESASTISGDVDAVYFYVSGVTVFFVTLISLVIIFFVIRYRRRNAFEIPRPIEGSHKLETLWSVIPLVIAMSIFVWGAKVYFAQYRPPQNALEVYVVGKQWMWKFQHPTGQREINELHSDSGCPSSRRRRRRCGSCLPRRRQEADRRPQKAGSNEETRRH